MARTARRQKDIKALLSDNAPIPLPKPKGFGRARNKRREFTMKGETLDWIEVVSVVCRFLCRGWTATEVVEELARIGIDIRREDPHTMLPWAGYNGHLKYVPAQDQLLSNSIADAYPALEEVDVVRTRFFEDVADQGAAMLLRLMQQHHRDNPTRNEVHIGFAGGYSMWKVARAFAQLLRSPADDLPKVLAFHSLVSSFDPADPRTDPNAFALYFMMDRAAWVDIQFVGLPTPPMAPSGEVNVLKGLTGIRQAYAAKDAIDIIVTSASVWSDEDSMLYKHMKACETSYNALQAAGCVGDLLWRPVGPNGPIEIQTDLRAMTLFELSHLPRLIQEEKKHVLLVLGPCGGCNRPKGAILKAVLEAPEPLITHLVTDIRSAREVYPVTQQRQRQA